MAPKATKTPSSRKKHKPTNVYYVQAGVDPLDPKRAVCSFFFDFDCQHPATLPLSIPKQSGEVVFVHVQTANQWLLVGAVGDRVDTAIVDPTFLPATYNQVSVPMPTHEVILQGVLLIFSSQGPTTQLYSSADPVVKNNGV